MQRVEDVETHIGQQVVRWPAAVRHRVIAAAHRSAPRRGDQGERRAETQHSCLGSAVAWRDQQREHTNGEHELPERSSEAASSRVILGLLSARSAKCGEEMWLVSESRF